MATETQERPKLGEQSAADVKLGGYYVFTPPEDAGGYLGRKPWYGSKHLREFNDSHMDGQVIKINPKSVTVRAVTEGEWNYGHVYKVPKDAKATRDLTELMREKVKAFKPIGVKQESKPESKPSTEAKEPWEMTLKEYQTQGRPNYGDMVTDGEYAGTLRGTGGIGSSRVIIEDKITGQKHYTDIDKVRLIRRLGRGSAIGDVNYDVFHKDKVKQALREGKPVPAEVLKDYPDLAKSTATKGKPNLYAEGMRILREGITITEPKSKAAPEVTVSSGLNPTSEALTIGTLEERITSLSQHGFNVANMKPDFIKDLINLGANKKWASQVVDNVVSKAIPKAEAPATTVTKTTAQMTKEEYFTARKEAARKAGFEFPEEPTTTKSTLPTAVTKEPWKMTRQEFVKQAEVSDKDVGPNKVYVTWDNGRIGDIAVGVSRSEATKEIHRMAIDYAIKKGKPVPVEVLKDYPELGKKEVAVTTRDVPPKGYGVSGEGEVVSPRIERKKDETLDEAIAREVGYQIDNGRVKLTEDRDGWKATVTGLTDEKPHVIRAYKKQQVLNEVWKYRYRSVLVGSHNSCSPLRQDLRDIRKLRQSD